MAGRKPKKDALTPQQRWNRHLAKMAKFDIKRQYYRASATQREQLRRLQIELGCSSRVRFGSIRHQSSRSTALNFSERYTSYRRVLRRLKAGIPAEKAVKDNVDRRGIRRTPVHD